MISVQDVEKLAELARINIPNEEKEALVKEIDSILAYVEQIKDAVRGVDVSSEDAPKVRNIVREDDHVHESGLYTEKILAEAPKRKGNYVKVKKIL